MVHIDHLIYIVDTFHGIIGHRFLQRPVEMLGENRLKRFIDKGRFARTAHARHEDEFSQGEIHVNVFQVVALGTTDTDELAVAFPSFGGYLD